MQTIGKKVAMLFALAVGSMLAFGVGSAFGSALTADEYPATIDAELSAPMVITVKGSTIKCGSGVFAGELSGGSTEVATTATYAECEMFGIAAKETMNGCFYQELGFKALSPTEYETTTEIVCPPTKEITIDTTPCVIHIPPQKALAKVKWTLKMGWFGKQWWEKDVEVAGLKTNMTKINFLCPVAAGESTNGTIVATIATHGRNSGGEPQNLKID